MRRKKRYEKQLQQIDGTLSRTEMQREVLEAADTNTALLETMRNVAGCSKGSSPAYGYASCAGHDG